MAKISDTGLNVSGENGHLYSLIQGKAFSISPLSMRLTKDLELKVLFHFIRLRKYSLVRAVPP